MSADWLMLVLGLLWVCIGLSVYNAGGPARILPNTSWLPAQTVYTAWIGTGGLAALMSFRPRGVHDALGWVMLYLVPGQQALGWLWTVLNGNTSAAPVVALHLLMCGAVYIGAGLVRETL